MNVSKVRVVVVVNVFKKIRFDEDCTTKSLASDAGVTSLTMLAVVGDVVFVVVSTTEADATTTFVCGATALDIAETSVCMR